MCKVISYSKENECVTLCDNEVEVIILPTTTKRLEIKAANNLKKIISLSDRLTIGPEMRKNTIPALNGCRNINEVVTFGNIEFNTTLRMRGNDTTCAWTTGDDKSVPPVMTIIGRETRKEHFPCYYYASSPVDETNLFDAEAVVRTLPIELFDSFLDSSLREVNEVMPLDSKLARI